MVLSAGVAPQPSNAAGTTATNANHSADVPARDKLAADKEKGKQRMELHSGRGAQGATGSHHSSFAPSVATTATADSSVAR